MTITHILGEGDRPRSSEEVQGGAVDGLAGILAGLRATSRGERVLFVLPGHLHIDAPAAAVIRREAAYQGVEVAFVTRHVGSRRALGREGISTFQSTEPRRARPVAPRHAPCALPAPPARRASCRAPGSGRVSKNVPFGLPAVRVCPVVRPSSEPLVADPWAAVGAGRAVRRPVVRTDGRGPGGADRRYAGL